MEEKQYMVCRVPEELQGVTVKTYLQTVLSFSGRRIASVKWAERGILLNGQQVNVRAVLQAGDLLQILRSDSDKRREKLLPYELPLEVLYEDEDLIAVNKPAGLVTHPSRGHLYDTLLNAIRFYLDEKGDRSHLHLLGRLDKETSGVLLVAKNSVAADRLQKEKQEGKFYKEYLAFLEGIPERREGTIDVSMQPFHDSTLGGKLKMSAAGEDPTGENLPVQTAVTHYRTEKIFQNRSLVRVWIETGRMHQIRFHMSTLGHPLLGDAFYGNGITEQAERTLLHAEILHLIHPVTGDVIEIKAPLPEDMKALLSGEDDIDEEKSNG